jgi:VWFA-related protein
MSHYVRLVQATAAWVLLSAVAPAQPSPPGAAASRDQDLIKIFFTVDNGHGALVPDLLKDSFQLREDGRPQTIQQFSFAQDLPLTLGVLVDTSGLMQGALPAEKAAADGFLRKLVQEKDLAFIMSFDVTVDLLQDLTSDRSLLHSGLEQARVNVGLHVRTRSGGALSDAVYLAGNEILRKQVGRKALVILTAGVDDGSKVKLKEAIQAAQKADAVCYVVQFFHTIFGQAVNDLAEQTGGRLISVSSVDKLQQALNQITDELRNQYSLGYVPDHGDKDGGFRAIEITSKEGYKVHARKGYYAPGP